MPIDQTTIKTLYVFVEIAIDSSHLAQTIRLNFPNDRRIFYEALINSEESDSQIPTGRHLTQDHHLRIEGPSSCRTDAEPDTSTASVCSSLPFEPTRLALVSTIQFVSALSQLKDDLTTECSDSHTTPQLAGMIDGPSQISETDQAAIRHPKLWTGKYEATIPRSKPLSPGEILGCTAPRLGDVDTLMYGFYIYLSLGRLD